MSKTATYSLITSYTVPSSIASYTLTNIPGTFTDLILVINGSLVGNGQFRFQVGNGSIDTGTNYSGTQVYGYASTVGSGREINASNPYLGVASTTNSTRIIQFNDYSNTTTYKTWLLKSGDLGQSQYDFQVSLWRSTAAINQIKINTLASNIASGTNFKLYGIQAGNA